MYSYRTARAYSDSDIVKDRKKDHKRRKVDKMNKLRKVLRKKLQREKESTANKSTTTTAKPFLDYRRVLREDYARKAKISNYGLITVCTT
jgi:hypothetical protein